MADNGRVSSQPTQLRSHVGHVFEGRTLALGNLETLLHVLGLKNKKMGGAGGDETLSINSVKNRLMCMVELLCLTAYTLNRSYFG